jgi:hypothetical protein
LHRLHMDNEYILIKLDYNAWYWVVTGCRMVAGAAGDHALQSVMGQRLSAGVLAGGGGVHSWWASDFAERSLDEMRILLMASKWGQNFLFCVSNRTDYDLFFSALLARVCWPLETQHEASTHECMRARHKVANENELATEFG